MKLLTRVPVWIWRLLMALVTPGEIRRFNADPIEGVAVETDIDYVGDGIRGHRLDVLTPATTSPGQAGPLPVYVYFHGGGWTSGDKEQTTKYCASQAVTGMVVVNVNYRHAIGHHMVHIMQDATAALRWVAENIADHGGDPDQLVLGGDSAGGQISALLAATVSRPELARHYAVRPAVDAEALRGIVQHCSAVDFSVNFDRGFVLGHGFIRMLLPHGGRGLKLRHAARFLSPIEWLHPQFPPVLITTSEQDFFYGANLNFIDALQRHSVEAETLVYGRTSRNARHTWQQNSAFPESQEVYRRVAGFVRRVTGPIGGIGSATRPAAVAA